MTSYPSTVSTHWNIYQLRKEAEARGYTVGDLPLKKSWLIEILGDGSKSVKAAQRAAAQRTSHKTRYSTALKRGPGRPKKVDSTATDIKSVLSHSNQFAVGLNKDGRSKFDTKGQTFIRNSSTKLPPRQHHTQQHSAPLQDVANRVSFTKPVDQGKHPSTTIPLKSILRVPGANPTKEKSVHWHASVDPGPYMTRKKARRLGCTPKETSAVWLGL